MYKQCFVFQSKWLTSSLCAPDSLLYLYSMSLKHAAYVIVGEPLMLTQNMFCIFIFTIYNLDNLRLLRPKDHKDRIYKNIRTVV